MEGLRKELGDERKKGQSPYGQPYPSPRPVNDTGVLTQSSILERTIGSVPDSSRTGNSFTFSGTCDILLLGVMLSLVPSLLRSPPLPSLSESFLWLAGGNGEVSVLAVEKLQQALRQREDEVAHLQHRLVDVRHNPT